MKPSAGVDAWNQPNGSYLELATVWAHVADPGATEREEADQTVTVRTKIFTIRHRGDVTTRNEITYDSDTYEITAIAEIGRKEGLRITAVARDND